MFKKLGLPMLALGGMLAFVAPHPAKAGGGVHFGITLGNPVYEYPVPYATPYVAPYAYSYPYYSYPYSYVAPYYGFRGHEHFEHERHERERRGEAFRYNRGFSHEHGG